VTSEVANVRAWAHIDFISPDFGLPSINKTINVTHSYAYATADNMCELFLALDLELLSLGDLGRGTVEVAVSDSNWFGNAFNSVVSVTLAVLQRIKLKEFLPCNRMTLGLSSSSSSSG
jgi:hypothetical protein